MKDWKGAQENVLKFISPRFICYVIDFVRESQITLARLFMCHTQIIIYYIKIRNTEKTNICGNEFRFYRNTLIN